MLTKRIVGLLLCLVVLGFFATGVFGADILVVTSNPNGGGTDDLIKDFLEGLGHSVTYIGDTASEEETEIAAAAADLVYISESVGSSQIRDEITEIETPMIVAEPYAWDEMGLTSDTGEVVEVQSTTITIVSPGHFLAAGLSGTVNVLTDITGPLGTARFAMGTPGNQATVIARAILSNDRTYNNLFVYEKGARLAAAPTDGSPQTAADIRIGMFYDELSMPLLNENAYELIAAAVNYALDIKGQARYPRPLSGAENVSPSQLKWSPGENTSSHNVYFGTSPTLGADYLAVEGLQDTTYQLTVDLTPNITYYWKVDEVKADGTINEGVIWSFTTAILTASNPEPLNEAMYVDTGVSLSWVAGYGAATHDVYLGTDKAAVTDANTSSPEFIKNQPETIYEPGSLVRGTTYYWRIDEVGADGTTQHKGASGVSQQYSTYLLPILILSAGGSLIMKESIL